jgi:hypothetical protein
MGRIEIRDVPEDVLRPLEVRAAAAGVSVGAYVLLELERVARIPTPEELDRRIRARGPSPVRTDEILAARDAGRRADEPLCGRRVPGAARGQIRIAEGFDDPLMDE